MDDDDDDVIVLPSPAKRRRVVTKPPTADDDDENEVVIATNKKRPSVPPPSGCGTPGGVKHLAATMAIPLALPGKGPQAAPAQRRPLEMANDAELTSPQLLSLPPSLGGPASATADDKRPSIPPPSQFQPRP